MVGVFKDNRVKVHEVVSGSVVLEIYKKVDARTNKVYFDYRTAREFNVSGDEVGRGPYCQQRDMRDNIIALANAMEWISIQHRKIRDNA